jgi:putative addiction module component (TIGR02574 family)
MTAIAIREEVRKLPRREQLLLIQYIVEILQQDEDFVLSDAWKEELGRREIAYRQGEERLYTWEEARQQISGKRLT